MKQSRWSWCWGRWRIRLVVPARRLAEQLVEQARADGVSLVGPGGLLADLTKRVLETGLEVEMSEHLGYDKHAVDGRDGGNSRNGTRAKNGVDRDRPSRDRRPA